MADAAQGSNGQGSGSNGQGSGSNGQGSGSGSTKEQKYKLKWRDLDKNTIDCYRELRKRQILTDITIGVGAEGQVIKAHQMVLATCSRYFKKWIEVNLRLEHPTKHPIILLGGVPYKDLVNILEFMYTGDIRLPHADLTSFLRSAATLEVIGLEIKKA